jgi:hypothetical protein
MLSDTLSETHALLQQQLFHYTSATYKNTYDTDVILEVQDIVNRIDELRKKLDNFDFEGSYRHVDAT